MSLQAYFPVLVQVMIALAIAGGILLVSHLFGQKARSNPLKDSAYECGLPAEGPVHPRFAIKFYIVAMLFILFDVEVVFLIPWVVIFREFVGAGIPILTPMLFFLTVLTIGLCYEIRKGALDWEK